MTSEHPVWIEKAADVIARHKLYVLWFILAMLVLMFLDGIGWI